MSSVWKNVGFQDKCHRKTDWIHQKTKRKQNKKELKVLITRKKYITLDGDRW